MFHNTTMPNDFAGGEFFAFLKACRPWHQQIGSLDSSKDDEPSTTDEACMVRYRQGDDRAFQILYGRYREKLHRYLLRLSNHSSEAEEIFQEVWIAVIRGKDRYEPNAPFGSWLFSIAHRRAADRWRTLSRHAPDWQSHGKNETEFETIATLIATTPERISQNDELGQALLNALGKLPLPQREAFLLKAEGDLSLEDIATVTQVSRETVKSRLRYAQQRLRDALAVWR